MGEYTAKHANADDYPTFVAGGTITGGQVVVFSAANTVVAASGASGLVAGIATKDAVANERLAVARMGVQVPTAGGSIAFGDPLKSAASGRVVPYVVGTDPVNQLIGYATEAATSGNPVTALWIR